MPSEGAWVCGCDVGLFSERDRSVNKFNEFDYKQSVWRDGGTCEGDAVIR